MSAHPLVRRLEVYGPLQAEERTALEEAARDVRRFEPREDILHEGAEPTAMNLVISGFAARFKTLEDGRRPILAIFVPGDFCDYRNYLLPRMEHGITALTAVELALLTASAVNELAQTYPAIDRAFSLAQLAEHSISREWTVNVGHRSAIERTAHLLCELYWRLRSVGRTRGAAYELPLTQIELGDTLGLSTVHTNRTLQELRRQRLITLRNRELVIHDLEALQDVARFEPGYLHLSATARGGSAVTEV